jgi:fluoride exporter
MTAALLLVALGGGAGGLLRVWVTAAVDRRAGPRLPWGTLAVNLSGSGLIGAGAGLLLPRGLEPATLPLWAALAVGVLGSYTTVSSFALQAHALASHGRRGAAAAYGAVTVAGCLAAAAAGLALGHWLVPAFGPSGN